MVSNQLGGINKPVGLLNINGYYDGFLSWLQHSVDEEFVSLENQNQVLVHNDPKELLKMVLQVHLLTALQNGETVLLTLTEYFLVLTQ